MFPFFYIPHTLSIIRRANENFDVTSPGDLLVDEAAQCRSYLRVQEHEGKNTALVTDCKATLNVGQPFRQPTVLLILL